MVCTSPIWIKINYPVKGPLGLRPYLQVPCGRCMSCRIRRRAEWTTRLYHEMGYHNDCKFVTLTYECNPVTLNPDDTKNFVKRYRKNSKAKIKYYLVGEYGDTTNRPHYHAIIFSDKPITDKDIRSCWGLGLTSTDSCTRESIQYVAGYIEKKLLGDDAVKYKEAGICPPFSRSSQGLGKAFAVDNAKQITDNLDITVYGKHVGIPKYYRKVLGLTATQMLSVVSDQAVENKMKWKQRGVEKDIDIYYEAKKGKAQHNLNVTAKAELYGRKKI